MIAFNYLKFNMYIYRNGRNMRVWFSLVGTKFGVNFILKTAEYNFKQFKVYFCFLKESSFSCLLPPTSCLLPPTARSFKWSKLWLKSHLIFTPPPLSVWHMVLNVLKFNSKFISDSKRFSFTMTNPLHHFPCHYIIDFKVKVLLTLGKQIDVCPALIQTVPMDPVARLW